MGFPLGQSIRALLFDFDGTLVSSMSDLKRIYFHFLEQFGKRPSDEEFASLVGPPLNEVVKILKQNHGLEPSVEELLANYKVLLQKHYSSSLTLFPGVKDFIHTMHKNNMKIALVTSANRPFVEHFLREVSLLTLFDAVVCGEDVKRGKPYPDIYQLALKRLSVQPEEAVAFEDALMGIQASIGASIFTCMFGWNEGEFNHALAHPVRDWFHVADLFKIWHEKTRN